MMTFDRLYDLLEEKAAKYEHFDFVVDDPICIPRSFSRLQDIEISALFASTLAWGSRVVIISKCKQLMNLMDNAPYSFVTEHTDADLRPMLNFKHRTFNATDLLYFIAFLRHYYTQNNSLEEAFVRFLPTGSLHVGAALTGFHQFFFSLDYAPTRTKKHLSTPLRGSACKRLNLFLRWLVRSNTAGVDFGVWQGIKPAQLLIPLDVHVERIARHLGLLQRKQADWQAVLELTNSLRQFDAADPVKYDFALFGMGVLEYKSIFN